MEQASSPAGVVVFLLTDIVGSTQLWETSPQRMERGLATHERELQLTIESHGGQVFKALGDGFYAAFPTPADAIAAGVRIQALSLGSAADGESLPLSLRVLIHAGPAIRRGTDYVGATLNRAARLLALAHGGQILVSGAAADMSRGFLPPEWELADLGAHRLRDVREPERVFQLIAPGLTADFPPLRSEQAVAAHLPRVLTDFIGRQQEIDAITGYLQRQRLLTLAGPGGSGKTRLALEVARRHSRPPHDLVCFVDLSHVTDAEVLVEEPCRALRLPLSAERSALETALTFLRERSALLVFDNCEQIVEASAGLVEAMLEATTKLQVIATSRERLGVPGEVVYRVGSLAVPPDGMGLEAAEALRYDAVTLFVERAQAVVPDFQLTDDITPPVVSICKQLDGLPLAIELIVPQLRTLGVGQLASNLGTRLLAARGDRHMLERHQTLQAVFDWSYNLLTDVERRVLRALSVFAGGWTLTSAATVVTCDEVGDLDPSGIHDLLASLVDKSLVSVDRSRAELRFFLLQPVQDYARSLLQEGEEGVYRARHAVAMLNVVTEAYGSWPHAPTALWRPGCEAELENIRRALDWAFAPEGDANLGLRLCGYAVRIWDEFSLLSERERWMDVAFRQDRSGLSRADEGRLWLGRLSASSQGDRTNFDPAMAAVACFQDAGDPLGEGESLAKAGAALLQPDSIEDAMPHLSQALALLRALPASKPLAACLRAHAIARYFVGDFVLARQYVQRSDEVARRLRDLSGHHAAQIAAAELEFAAGEVVYAVDVTRELLTAETASHRHMILARTNLAAYLLAQDRVVDAESEALAGLKQARALGWRAGMARALEHLALAQALQGRLDRAMRLLEATAAFYESEGASREFTELATYRRLTEILAPITAAAGDTVEAFWSLDEAAEVMLRPDEGLGAS